MRSFGGLSIEETAELLELSPATIKRHWSTAGPLAAPRNEQGRADMTPESWERVCEVFGQVMELAPEIPTPVGQPLRLYP